MAELAYFRKGLKILFFNLIFSLFAAWWRHLLDHF